MIEIAKSLKQHHGIHSTHMRDEGDRIMDSLDETLKIGTQAQTPVIISHHKCAGIQNFGRSTETLKKIEEMLQKHNEQQKNQHLKLILKPDLVV